MPLPDSRVILAAKAYAHQIELERSPDQARDYIARGFGLTGTQVRSAIRQAQRAMRVGEVLAELRPEDTVREALEGQRAPARTVGVRVEVTRIDVSTSRGFEDRKNTLYVEVPWDATIHDVLEQVRTWFENTEQGSGPAHAWEIAFKGPSLWPGHSSPRYGGLE